MRRRLPARRAFGFDLAAIASGLAWAPLANARQNDLTVAQVASRLHAVPFLLARDRGWFREMAGIDVRRFIGSSEGGVTLRNALAAELPYGEVSLPAVIAAIGQGVELTIVHGGVQTLADQVWVVRRGETGIASPRDLAGRKVGYTGPGTLSDMVSRAMIDSLGLAAKVERKVVGPVREKLAALRDGSVDVVMVAEPRLSRERDWLRPVWGADQVLGPCAQTVGVVRSDWLLRNGDRVRGIIAARRRAVAAIREEPAQAALMITGHYGMDPALALGVVERLLVGPGFWSDGSFAQSGMDAMHRGMQTIGALPAVATADWRRALRADYLSFESAPSARFRFA